MSLDIGARIRAKVVDKNVLAINDQVTLEKIFSEPSHLSIRNNSLFRSLSYGMMRWHHRLNWQVDKLVTKKINPRDKKLKSLLRLGLFQLQFTRIPDHASVSETVNAAEILGIKKTKGLVNAVLRRFLREGKALERPMQENIQAVTSHPRWMINIIKNDWPNHWQQILEANNSLPPMWIRVNKRKVIFDDYLKILDKNNIDYEYTIENDLLKLKNPIPMRSLPKYNEGWVSIQDASSQLSVEYLKIKNGDRILDACAAPGGKSSHILELNQNVDELVSVDINNNRLKVMRENLNRLGHRHAIVAGDSLSPSKWWDGKHFQKILLDAPCSSLGVIRRHPDIKVLRTPKDIENILYIQDKLLHSLWPLLETKGNILYTTCSIIKKENEDMVSNFVKNTPDATFDEELFGGEKFRQILPGENDMDGFFYSSIKKVDL
ncbi:MAG: 16S rRNA (cytosine(967)-C(5))-methyltransferase [Gammaproteobacteria bacterium TMED78]|nr:MAG: 16S rRNA (cytosine(967)-C(5))-methyltransferase [Gammaproteobacteria bacterium TMED78]